jgi:hypothetical protein
MLNVLRALAGWTPTEEIRKRDLPCLEECSAALVLSTPTL